MFNFIYLEKYFIILLHFLMASLPSAISWWKPYCWPRAQHGHACDNLAICLCWSPGHCYENDHFINQTCDGNNYLPCCADFSILMTGNFMLQLFLINLTSRSCLRAGMGLPGILMRCTMKYQWRKMRCCIKSLSRGWTSTRWRLACLGNQMKQ